MNFKKYLLLLIVANALVSSLYAEISDTTKPKKIFVTKRVLLIRSAPSITLQLNFHYDQPMGQLAGTYNDDFRSDEFIAGRSLGVNKGIGGSIMAKFSSPNDHIRFTFSAAYNRLLTYVFDKSIYDKSDNADVGRSHFNVFSGGIGMENNFTPNHKVKLYVGAEAIFSIINGNATIWVENRYYTPYTYDLKVKNSYRLGGSIFGGAEYMVSNTFALNLGFKLTHANLFLKEAKSSDNPYEIDLLDDESTSVPPLPYSGKKQFAFLSIVTGVSFYWGVVEKRYILPR